MAKRKKSLVRYRKAYIREGGQVFNEGNIRWCPTEIPKSENKEWIKVKIFIKRELPNEKQGFTH